MNAMVGSEHVRLESVQLRRLEVASLAEATTLLLLIGIAVPLTHVAGQPLGVTIMGPVHGLAFCFYIWPVVETIAAGGWRGSKGAWLVITAFVPIAGYSNLSLIRRKARVRSIGMGTR